MQRTLYSTPNRAHKPQGGAEDRLLAMSQTATSQANANRSSNPAPSLAGLLKAAAQDGKLRGMMTHLGEGSLHMQAPEGAWPFVVGTLAQRTPLLVVTATGRQAQDLTTVLRYMLGDRVELFPSWETLPHEKLSPAVETVSTRMRVLRRLHEGDENLQVVVAPTRAAVQPVQSNLGEVTPVRLKVGEEIDFDSLTHRLQELGYTHVDVVGKRGHFAIRGGIADIFPATEEMPVRVDFWGDEITEVRAFSVGDQRTIPGVEPDEVMVYACRELIVTDEVASKAKNLAQEHAGNAELAEILDKISQKIQVQGMESLIPALHTAELVALPELMPEGYAHAGDGARGRRTPRPRPARNRSAVPGGRLGCRRHGRLGADGGRGLSFDRRGTEGAAEAGATLVDAVYARDGGF